MQVCVCVSRLAVAARQTREYIRAGLEPIQWFVVCRRDERVGSTVSERQYGSGLDGRHNSAREVGGLEGYVARPPLESLGAPRRADELLENACKTLS